MPTKSAIAGSLRAATFVVAMASASGAMAAPVFYTDASLFAAGVTGAGGTVTAETLNSFPTSFNLTTGPITFGGITVSSNAGFNGQLATASYGSGRAVLMSTPTGGGTVTFTFATAVNAFGIDVYDLGTLGATSLTVTTSVGSQVVYNNVTGGTGNLRFAGIVDTAATFTSITLSNTRAGDYIEFDTVRYARNLAAPAAAPEPGALSLLLVGLLGLAMRRRDAA